MLVLRGPQPLLRHSGWKTAYLLEDCLSTSAVSVKFDGFYDRQMGHALMEPTPVEVALRVNRSSLRDTLSCGGPRARRINRSTKRTIRDRSSLGKKLGSLNVPLDFIALALHSNG